MKKQCCRGDQYHTDDCLWNEAFRDREQLRTQLNNLKAKLERTKENFMNSRMENDKVEQAVFNEQQERIELLETALNLVLPYLEKSTDDLKPIHAVYITPSEQLRRQADSIELKDKAIQFARDVIKK